MGMRATIAYIDNKDVIHLTTVQWSTRLDQTLGHYFSEERKAGKNAHASMKALFEKIAANEHISCLDLDLDYNPENDYRGGAATEHIGHNVYLKGMQGDELATFESEHDISGGIYGYHLNGGSIGAIYKAYEPNKVEFFWSENATDIGNAVENLDELADFYSNAEDDSDKVKEYSFR